MKKSNRSSFIGSLVRKRRRELKISQEKLGEMIDVSYQQIQKYESGVNRVSADKLRDIASALNINVSYFYKKPVSEETQEEAEAYDKINGLSPDEKELITCFRIIDDREFRKRFLYLLMRAAKRG